ncbi:MAG: TRAP transporter small permease subunit [Rhodobiaceae bacterium]|nr:TRAP transporter small permease subunit [Rhodobiaceae bacterium]
MGTILAIAAIVMALVLVGVPFGPHIYVLGALIVLLWVAAMTRPKPALLIAAGVLTGFVGIANAPFDAPRKFFNVLKKAAKDGDAGAQSTMDLWTGLATYHVVLELVLVVLLIAAIVVAARRSHRGAHQFLFDGAEGLGEFAVGIGRVAAWLFIPMMAIIFYDVMQRKYLDYDQGFADSFLFTLLPSTKLQEGEWHLHGILFLLCLGYAYMKDAHVRIELVRDHMGPRSRVWLELLGCTLFLIPYCMLIYGYGYQFAEKSFAINEVSASLTGLPHRWVIKSFLPIGFTVLALAGAAVWLKCFVYLFGPPDLRQKTAYYAGTHHADIPEDMTEEVAVVHNPGGQG